jgi:hypothetical protein
MESENSKSENTKKILEKNKTTFSKSKKEIDYILEKYGVSNDKRIIELIKLMEEQYGFLVLSMVDINVEIYSKLELDDIIFNIKKNTPSDVYVYSFANDIVENDSDDKNSFIDSIISSINDSYIEHLNYKIKENDNMIVSAFMTSINILQDKSFKSVGTLKHSVKFF